MEKPRCTHSHTNLAIKFLNVHSAAVNKNTTLLETTLLADFWLTMFSNSVQRWYL